MSREDGATETISRGCSENGIEKSKTDRGSFGGSFILPEQTSASPMR